MLFLNEQEYQGQSKNKPKKNLQKGIVSFCVKKLELIFFLGGGDKSLGTGHLKAFSRVCLFFLTDCG